MIMKLFKSQPTYCSKLIANWLTRVSIMTNSIISYYCIENHILKSLLDIICCMFTNRRLSNTTIVYISDQPRVTRPTGLHFYIDIYELKTCTNKKLQIIVNYLDYYL